MVVGTAIIRPSIIRFPISVLTIPAAAIAPGCGGIRQCTEYKPAANMVAINIMGFLLAFTRDLLIPLKTINPESQKIGIPVINPVIPIAKPDFFSPTSFSIAAAILMVAPVLSRITPIIVPRMIIIPMDFIVSPNPWVIAGKTLLTGKTIVARTRETINMETKVLYLKAEVRTTIRTILISTQERINTKLIIKFLDGRQTQ
jgi:hypothetical protein